MIEKNIDNESAKKDKLLKLSLREIRLEAKKLSLELYSRKTKKELVELLLKDQKKLSIENKSNDDVVAEEDRVALEEAKEERISSEKTNAKENEVIISNKNKNLKRFLSKLFPNKKITVTDNKDGSQTILIN